MTIGKTEVIHAEGEGRVTRMMAYGLLTPRRLPC